ncbi:FAD-dependent oxidoreductase [Arthrobacter sp. efr-133-TYG-118]|uniref:FAD-dependent oxidoreductase n=1 Tax=Arthrobacter sp. efr-133-TYG-118 TaxID=3040279 RepID=UPI00254CF05E|nr:FAD-dependent oxidoreductase [Arthrobacter sp. efr-133-TYG-118]
MPRETAPAPGRGPRSWETRCCVVGGGPAGMMLGYLLARAGVEVTVLEKHADFFRDFRGDTIHPATTDVLAELGLLEEFLRLPHTEIPELRLGIDGQTFGLVDFRHLPTRCKFMAFMPQWDFLNFLAAQARKFPGFRLEMSTEATGLLRRGEQVIGVRAHTNDGEVEIRADLTVACDGRFSLIRDHTALPLREFAMPIDVLWFRVPRSQDAPPTLGYLGGGQIVLAIDRGDYWQCGTIIGKGALLQVQAAGLPAFRDRVAHAAPFLATGLAELTDWDQIKLLSVRSNRLRRWYQLGLLCIGDAAHAMSPAGAAGVNYAIADAVATANHLAVPLRSGTVAVADLQRLQRRREPAVRLAQALQRQQTRQLARLAQTSPPIQLMRLISHMPPIKRLLGRIVGLGFRREHIRSPHHANHR